MDGDGLPNDWELANGLSPKDSTSDHGANGDPDRDGVTNFQEFLSGTDPRDSSSLLKISSVTRGATRGIRFTAVPARTYPVQYRDTVGSGAWLKLADVPAQPSFARWKSPARAQTTPRASTAWSRRRFRN